jgi:hypothetical protein
MNPPMIVPFHLVLPIFKQYMCQLVSCRAKPECIRNKLLYIKNLLIIWRLFCGEVGFEFGV